MAKKYDVTDGSLALTLRAAEGGYAVTSTMDPALETRAGSIEEAFTNARDALERLYGPVYEGSDSGPARWSSGFSEPHDQRYLVSDGRMVLEFITAAEGGYCVIGIMEPGLVTQGETIEDAFFMARDALKGLRIVRRQLSSERARERARRPTKPAQAGAAA